MAGLILGIWILTAFGGAYMWSFTTGAGRPESNVRLTALPGLVLFLHPLIGLTGLVLWIAYLYHGGDILPWIAFGGLVVGATLGDVMLVRTLRPRRRQVYGAIPPEQETLPPERAAIANSRRVEDLIPRPVMVLHGTLAVVLIVLVLLYALGIHGGDDASYELFSPALRGLAR